MGGGGGSVQSEPGPASNALATISRDNFDNWWWQYRPRTAELALEVNNPVTLARNLNTTSRTIGRQFGEQQVNMNRNMSRLGVEATPQQQAAIQRQGALAQAGMDVAARNNIRSATRERDAGIIGGI